MSAGDMHYANLRIRLYDAVGGDPDTAQAIWEIISPALAERDDWQAAARGWEDRAERVEAERDALKAAIERVRARHIPHDCHRDHIKASTPIPCVNDGLCRCGNTLPCDERAILDDELLELLPGAEHEGMDAYDQIPRAIKALRTERDALKAELERVRAVLSRLDPEDVTWAVALGTPGGTESTEEIRHEPSQPIYCRVEHPFGEHNESTHVCQGFPAHPDFGLGHACRCGFKWPVSAPESPEEGSDDER